MNDDGDLAHQVASQRRLLHEWLATDEARRVAQRLVSRRNLGISADDLINEAWIRIERSFSGSSDARPDIADMASAARYCARILDNLARDHTRAASRRRELPMSTFSQDTITDRSDPESDPAVGRESRILVEQLLFAVGRRAEGAVTCDGCPPEVVAAAALEILHLVLDGDDTGDRGRTWFDQILHTALGRVDPLQPTTEAARNQRKSRCGRCVSELLQASMDDLMGGRS